MLYIQKKNCPDHIQDEIETLIESDQWRNIPEEPSSEQTTIIRRQYFDKLTKSSIREALIAEQHGLCAYCMARVENTKGATTIEHLIPLSKSKSGAMNYHNWLAVCMGGQNTEPKQGERRVVCCDVKKGNNITALSPLNQSQMDQIAYYDDGTIIYNTSSQADQDHITHEINYTFGLNGKVDPQTGHSRKDTTTGIVKARKDAYIAMRDLLMALHSTGELTPEMIKNFQQSLLSDMVWEPFVGVKLYVLKNFPNV